MVALQPTHPVTQREGIVLPEALHIAHFPSHTLGNAQRITNG